LAVGEFRTFYPTALELFSRTHLSSTHTFHILAKDFPYCSRNILLKSQKSLSIYCPFFVCTLCIIPWLSLFIFGRFTTSIISFCSTFSLASLFTHTQSVLILSLHVSSYLPPPFFFLLLFFAPSFIFNLFILLTLLCLAPFFSFYPFVLLIFLHLLLPLIYPMYHLYP
jgi:hypothetical protein